MSWRRLEWIYMDDLDFCADAFSGTIMSNKVHFRDEKVLQRCTLQLGEP
jgi:hypothetical protein